MPTYLRKFYLQKMHEAYKEESDNIKKQNKKSKISRAGISSK